MSAPYVIRGVNESGEVAWYSGLSGSAAIAPERAQAREFSSLSAARVAAQRLNVLLWPATGFRFVVPVDNVNEV